jgi:hypothetical protein
MRNGCPTKGFIAGFPSLDSFICSSGAQLIPNRYTQCTSYYICSRDSRNLFRSVEAYCPNDNPVFSAALQRCAPRQNTIC